ncbi:TMV resistance protein N-like [Prunus avium]|uniref:TMV resistance protein N-like n=1 Tax=Prunus avium TaxID=42229 RepID=A0A6P5RER1_PRUAV|nr:TMV resistance protein N-like [Prunus avium]
MVGIQNLIDRCLVTIDEFDKVLMHDLICGMGREIVNQESEEPWKRSRVWHHKDSFKILSENNGTRTIEGLVFDMHMLPTNILINSNEIVLETNAFAKMRELKLLHLSHVQLNGSYAEFCTGLRWLCWTKFPLDSIPTEFSLRSLVVLEMRYSSLRQVCKGTKCLPSLKILDLSHSHSLTETTDFSFCPNLEKLILTDCVSLIYVHGSIGNLERLVYLNTKDCKNLKMLPENICMLKLLETLIISGCTSLNELSIEMLRNIESLKVLDTDGILIGELVPGRSSCFLSSLTCSLVDLNLQKCNISNDAFPREFSNLSSLRRLNVGYNPICSLPNCIKGLTRLNELSFWGCGSLKLLEGLPKVATLNVADCFSLEKITYQCRRSRTRTMLLNNRNLVEWENMYKLEPIGSVDAEMINLLGLSNLESMAPIRMGKRNWTSAKDVWNPVEGLYQKGIFSTFFAGNEVPGQFSHKSTKSPISFTVPLLDNQRIQGLKVFVVYTNLHANYSAGASPGPPGPLVTKVRNKSKGLKWIYCPIFYGIPGEGEDMIWLSLWKLEEQVHLEGGDEVVVSVIMQPWLQVKEFGIQLVQQLQQENHNMMTVSTDASYYPRVSSGNLGQYQPGVYLLFSRNEMEDPIWFNKILEDSDDEDTTVKEEEQHYDQTIAVTTSSKSGGLRGWKGKVLKRAKISSALQISVPYV